MKKLYILMMLCVWCVATSYAQAVSDGAAVKSAISAKRSGQSESQIASSLLQQGATPAQLQRLRGQYAKQISKAGMDAAVDNGLREAINRQRTNNEAGEGPVEKLAERKTTNCMRPWKMTWPMVLVNAPGELAVQAVRCSEEISSIPPI